MKRGFKAGIGIFVVLITANSSPAGAQRTDVSAAVGGTIAASATTPSNDGVARLSAVRGSVSFNVSANNKGDSRTITVKAETGEYPLPLVLEVCRTNALGHCFAKPAASVTAVLPHGSVSTYSVRVQGTDILPLMKIDRAYLNFYDENGNKVGGTSVALDDGSAVPQGSSPTGIYSVRFQMPSDSSYDLSGQGLYIVTPDDGFIVTSSGFVTQQAVVSSRPKPFYTTGLFYPFPNTPSRHSSNSNASILALTATDVLDHWITAKYQLYGGRVKGFEDGTAFASYRAELSQRGSSQAQIKGRWTIRYKQGGAIVGTMIIDKNGSVVGGRIQQCPLFDGTITSVDPQFNAYKVKFQRTALSTNNPLCVDVYNASGVAATFDTVTRNDTLRILMKGQSDGYSWILTRN